jgi:membrane protein YqaA with SNARE-associated domain
MLLAERIEYYKLLFMDSFNGNLVVSVDIRLMLNIALSFLGNRLTFIDFVVPIIVSVCGYICAIAINCLIGMILLKICILSKNQALIDKNYKYANIIARYSKLFLLLSLVPIIGKFVPLIAGFFRLNFTRVILFCGLYDLCYCVLVVYCNVKSFW